MKANPNYLPITNFSLSPPGGPGSPHDKHPQQPGDRHLGATLEALEKTRRRFRLRVLRREPGELHHKPSLRRRDSPRSGWQGVHAPENRGGQAHVYRQGQVHRHEEQRQVKQVARAVGRQEVQSVELRRWARGSARCFDPRGWLGDVCRHAETRRRRR